MQYLKKNIFLLLFSSFLGLALLNFFVFEKDAPGAVEEYYISTLKNRVKSEMQLANNELNEIALQYKKTPENTFFNLEKATKYPYYIFKNGQLYYWSDYSFVPDYQQLKTVISSRLLTTDNGQYIVNFLPINYKGNSLEVFSLINLYKKFRTENDYLQNNYNNNLFISEPEELSGVLNKSIYKNISDDKGQFLFAVTPPNNLKHNLPTLTLYLFGCAIAFLGIYLWSVLRKFQRNNKIELAFLILAFYLVFVRFLMLVNRVPFFLYESKVFNPKYLSISRIAPSLGDLVLNALVVFILISYLVYFLYRLKSYYKLFKATNFWQTIVSICLVLITFLVTFLCYINIKNIYQKSNYLLDLSLSISFNSLKIFTLIFYLFLATIFFLSTHFLVSWFARLNKIIAKGVLRWGIGFAIGFILLVIFGEFNWIYVVASIYFLLIYLYNLPRYLYNFKYKTTLYFFGGAIAFALITTIIIAKEDQYKNLFDKHNFGQRYLAENDFMGEGLLAKVIQTVEKDTAIHHAIRRPFLAQEQTQQLVKSKHLDLYFDRYDMEVLVFDSEGKSLDISENSRNLSAYETEFKKPNYKTINPAIFFINNLGNNFIKQYITFIPIKEASNLIGHVVINLKLRDEFVQNTYPELLLDKKFTYNSDTKNYSYAIFDKENKLVFSSGSYNYIRKFPSNLLADTLLYTKGIISNEYSHVGKIGNNKRKIVVSSKDERRKNLYATFSFLFLFTVVIIILVMLFYAIRYGIKKIQLNFSTKIQLYLNLSFLLPLLLVIVINLSVIDSTFVNNQNKAYIENTKNIASTVQLQLKNFLQKKMTRAFLEQEINNLARDTKLDINFYGVDGKLNLTTRPLVYQYGLLSEYINPDAYRRIIEEKENEVLLTESLGNLIYKTAYVNIKTDDGKAIGVVGIPFFDARPTLNRQVISVISTILSIFAFIFLLLLIISFFAASTLTNPLRLVAQKLKRTSLDKLNDRLEWKADDEIGSLMREYNKMLEKLEESKLALSLSEKQTAWQEMAKQVAHEIKNPLTPMKLSVQQLQRTLVVDNPKSKERIERALASLTEQIDNISEIANSFSEFAKMPVPQNELFDLVPLIQKAGDLYAEDERISVNTYIKAKEAWVRGDRQFMSRVITNLIINGIQSVSKEHRPIINLRLYRNDDDNIAIMEVQDNGAGIPENIRQRVFIPNFTTKISGSGLGLAMARRGVEHAGGNIWFETQIDKGTTFFIDLPLVNKSQLPKD